MSKRDLPTPKSILLPALLVPILLCLAGAVVLTWLTRTTPAVTAPVDQLSYVVQRVPFEAQNALRGDSSSFDALANSGMRLKSLRGALSDINRRVSSHRSCSPSWATWRAPSACRNWRA